MSIITFKSTQYICAVLLIVSSIFLVAFQVFTIADVANGLLIYIGQAFLLAGSIFGLDYYVKMLTNKFNRQNHESQKEGNHDY